MVWGATRAGHRSCCSPSPAAARGVPPHRPFSSPPVRISIIIHESDDDTLERIRAQVASLREIGEEVFPRLTFEPGDAAWMAREACERGCDLLIAAGGDGTVNEAVNGVHGWVTGRGGEPRQAPHLAILPLGTGNDLAAALGIPADVDAAMQIALHGSDLPLDIGMVDGRCFVNVSTGGFGAEATEETSTEAKRVLGPLAYLVTGVRKFATLDPLTATVTSQGEIVADGRFLLFAVGNSRRTGGGNFLTPRADPSDGLLDLCLVREISRVEFLRLLPQLRAGEHLDHPAIIYRQLPQVTVEAREELSVNADGEAMNGRRFHYSVSPVQLTIKQGTL